MLEENKIEEECAEPPPILLKRLSTVKEPLKRQEPRTSHVTELFSGQIMLEENKIKEECDEPPIILIKR